MNDSEPTDLAPGLLVVHGNHPEALRDLMLAWLARHPLAPLEDEWVLVQSNGVAQWLKLALARDPAEGGIGIAAALQTALPSRFLWQAYRAVLGPAAVPALSPFDKPPLIWRLMRLLPGLLAEPVFAPLSRFLADDPDGRKRHQLAERLADLFDQYQVYRADWLADWAAGGNDFQPARGPLQPVPGELLWQPRLWRAVLADVGEADAASSRATVHRRFLAAVAAGPAQRPAGLPRRITVFGISSLPQQSLEALAALARWSQVLMCVHNPCQHDWSHIVADQDLLRASRLRQRRRRGGEGEIDEAALHLHAQPLLAAWGKQGRDFIRLLDAHDDAQAYAQRFAAIGQRIDCFDANPGDTLLRQLQDDIRDLRPLAETRALWPALRPARDPSLRFHVCHGPQREVEVLHDQLLAAFAADPSLQPRDVIVMVPDVATYAPHVQAVFGLPVAGDRRHIPFSLADRGQRHHDPLLSALERLLALPQSRVAVSDVLDWLEVPALRRRFGLTEADLPLLHRWITAAQVRWGLHAPQRRSLDLPDADAANSWDFGLQRMLLGYASGAGPAWAGIEPLDEVAGLEAALLGPLIELLTVLERQWRLLSTPATPVEWGQRLRELLAALFSAEDDADGYTLMRLERLLQDWLTACAAAALDEPLPLSVVRDHWLAQLDQNSLQQPFFAGAVTVATLMPMRAIPFRVVALLGMNDGDYPRSRDALDFDLMGQDWRPGDRSRREDDRYLFLEALLSARERLHISWVGRSIHDDTERPPSVLVAQLRDHLAAGWRLAGDEALPNAAAGQRLLQALTVPHRLQPFHPDYFRAGGDDRLFSHAREWRSGWPAAAQPAAAADPALPAWTPPGPLTLRQLGDHLRLPVRSFLRLRLGVYLAEDDPVSEDQEPFALDRLQHWQLQDELILAQLAALAEGQPRQPALQAQLARMARRGQLPVGAFGRLLQDDLAEPMQALFDAWDQALQDWPQALPDQALDHLPPGLGEALRLQDSLGGLRANAQGQRCRLVLESTSLMKEQHVRLDKLLGHWVGHLAGHLAGQPLCSLLVSKNGSVLLRPLPTELAHAAWGDLLLAWEQGLNRPLPFAPRSAAAWLAQGGAVHGSADAAAREAARKVYETQDARQRQFAEVRSSQDLARVFPSFDALWAGGEFADWCLRLMQPLNDAVVRAGEPASAGPQPREAA